MVKLLMSWDIKEGRDAEYFEFVVREWVPGITRLGLQPTEAWYTVFGDQPQVLTGGVAKDLDSIHEILASTEWEELQSSLEEFVMNYQQKVVPNSGSIQLM